MDSNLDTYNSPKTQKWYGELKGLTSAESKIFDSVADQLKKGRLLDIGIGGGRTTQELIHRCENYTGIDYSNNFVQQCRVKFPKTDIRLMDARDLSSFPDNFFDLVNFSFNGIDYVNQEDRKKILKEIQRVLKPSGLFFFSTHNRAHSTFNKAPWLNKEMPFMYNFKTFLRFAPFYFKKLINQKKEINAKDHSLIIDHAHGYSLLTCYSEPEQIKKELTETGFNCIKLYDKEGLEREKEKLNDWIYVTALKTTS